MALDMFLSPLVSLVVNKAADKLIKEFCQTRDMEENRQNLAGQLMAIQQMISDAEMRGGNNMAVQEWMKELQAAAYKAVDVLDEIQYEGLRQKAIRDQPSSSSSSAMVVKGFFSNENPILFRQKISSKLAKVLAKIDEIVTKMDKFKFTLGDPIPLIDRETQSSIMEPEVFGRDREREKIVNDLLDRQRESDNISVLPIIGMGGMGKTTLAQLLYNHERVKAHFQLLLWVCVSTEFNVINIITSIIHVAEKGKLVSTPNKEVLQQRLHEILQKKKYLLVLDDVWNEEREKWDELKTMLFSGANSGSVIVVTTRSKEVASIMGTLQSHNLTSLSKEDSWRLFEMKAFVGRVKEPSEELIKIGRLIVSKCGGLPLVVKAIGGLMGSKPNVREWRAMAENKIWDSLASSSSEGILKILKLSYNNLPSHIQQCFAFCAVFPQDYSIERDELIQLWMANDFIPTDRTTDLEGKARHIFNVLCWRSFFQDIKENDTNYGSIVTCKMHDLMHDLATQLAGKKCSAQLKLDQKEIQHLFVPKHGTLEFSIPKEFPIIHTLLAKKCDGFGTKHCYSLESSSLRALQYQPGVSLPKVIGYMKHLRFLDLSGGEFHSLPESMNKLYNLQTLKLSDSQIRELPTRLRYMSNLRHIFLDNCFYLERMPIGLGQLKCLSTLTKYVVDQERGGRIEELKNINLCGHLTLCGLHNVSDRRDAEAVNLIAKSNLNSLELEWESTELTRNDQAILDALIPHNELKVLRIGGYNGSCFPKWMNEYCILKNLKSVRLSGCNNCSELPPMWKLPLLEDLNLIKMESLISIVNTCRNADGNDPMIIFPSLMVLNLVDLPNLEGWRESNSELVVLPNLNDLRIYDCPKLKNVPILASLATLIVENSDMIRLRKISDLPMLFNLDITTGCDSNTETDVFRPPKTLKSLHINGFENVIPLEEEEEGDQSLETNSLRRLTIRKSNCFFSYAQTKLALGFWKHFAALEYLLIDRCHKLVYWPEVVLRSLKCLKGLTIWTCHKLMGALPVSSSPCGKDSVALPQLESLFFWDCPELVEVPNRYCMSLDTLSIDDCPKLSREWSANLAKLKKLEISYCKEWRALPDNMGHLPSLKHLNISGCMGMESLPEGLQHRLPSLQSLKIAYSPTLERRCRRGGDYWPLIEHIPKLDLDEQIPKRESILSRFVPACGKRL